MNNDLYNVLFKLLSLSDESDIRMVCSSLLGYLVGKGKISVDELDEYIPVIKIDTRMTVRSGHPFFCLYAAFSFFETLTVIFTCSRSEMILANVS